MPISRRDMDLIKMLAAIAITLALAAIFAWLLCGCDGGGCGAGGPCSDSDSDGDTDTDAEASDADPCDGVTCPPDECGYASMVNTIIHYSPTVNESEASCNCMPDWTDCPGGCWVLPTGEAACY